MSASRRELLASVASATLVSGILAPVTARAALPSAQSKGALSVAPRLQPFDMADVTLLESPFLAAQRGTEAYLLSLEPDRMLANFRTNAGLAPKAPVYGGWESEATWADIHCHGHTLGHYLSACALMFRSTGDGRFKQRIDYIADELDACQRASGVGLVCAFPEGAALVAAHIRGEPITGVPWYTLHKIFAGLRDAWQLAGSDTARLVLLRMADWAVVATRPLDAAAFEAMLATEHGGMNEVIADLYVLTGKADYRTLAERFSQKAVMEPAAKGRDLLDGMHANTQVPKFVGFQRVYEVNGEKAYGDAAAFFWRTVARTRSYATGGHGDAEFFYPPADFAAHVFSAKGSETCGQHNMLKLTRALFLHDPQVELADFYERALYNGILASQDPETGLVTYFQGARPGYMKLYCTPIDSFWCCAGSGMENHAKYRDSIYFHDAEALVVNLFIPSSVRWRDKGAVLTQTTRFPEEPSTTLRWSLARPIRATLRLRHARWSRTARVSLNGAPLAQSTKPGSYLELDRSWRDGDILTLQLDMQVRVEASPAAPGIVAFTYGPVVLAGALGTEGLAPGSDVVVNERLYGQYNDTPFSPPQLAGDAETIAGQLRPGTAPLEFMIPDREGRPVRLIPYYQIRHERYATYWPLHPASN
ncbi:glycoside hydrolase family 127 protein [Sphingobium sp. B11D3D]|uniref:glycoside hydrolase family 127 protein n=1 Tax=Sphingobium sp. B11D3D TaxID=2940576 RepID=UPI0029CAC1EE|nr:beta-L-arabinofuranosidase domain-containing protein [Sphingobium sp. B11D3D]MCW2368432.1 DUF1680 family protein [Sphingobium sp. B11D3D]